MDPILDIRFKNGRQSLRDLTIYTSSEPFGINVMSEFDLRWDDISSEGLILEISTQMPEADERPEFGKPIQELDDRGPTCRISGAAYIHILEPEDMKFVSQIKYKNEVMVQSMGDELVVFGKLSALVATYLGDIEVTYDAINTLYPILARRHAYELAPADGARVDIDRAIALEMGISDKVLADAREYAYLASEAEAEAKRSRDVEDRDGALDGGEYDLVVADAVASDD